MIQYTRHDSAIYDLPSAPTEKEEDDVKRGLVAPITETFDDLRKELSAG